MSQNCCNSESLLMSMRRSIGFAPPHYFAVESQSDSPYINRFVSADTIVPNPTNSQALNRYSYVLNNPLRYTDPTGHICISEGEGDCEDEDEHPINGAGGFGGGSNSSGNPSGGGGGGFHPSLVIPELPCGGMMSCGQQTAYEYAASLLPFTSSDACYFLLHNPILCNSNSWQNFPNVSITLSPTTGCLQDFGACYDPDAIMWGTGFSGSMPGIYSTSGLEEIVMFTDGTRAVFSYGGEGGSAGLGASGAAYGGVVFNLSDPDNYVGPFGSGGLTISVLDAGVTASYFWDSSKAPFSAGTTQGLAVGYAPGAQASVWWSTTSYSETWRSDR
jgi:hypothetical protein